MTSDAVLDVVHAYIGRVDAEELSAMAALEVASGITVELPPVLFLDLVRIGANWTLVHFLAGLSAAIAAARETTT